MALSHQLSLSPKRLVWHLSCSFRKTASKLYYPSRRDSKNGGIDGSDALPVLPRGLRGSRVTCQGIGCHKPHSTLTSNFPFSLRTTPFTAHMKHCLLQSQPLLMTAHPYQVLLPSPESGVSVRARSPEERLRAKVKWEAQADEQLGPHQLWAGWVGWNQVRPTGFCHTENTYDHKGNKFTFQVTSCLLFDLASITPLVSLLVSWDRLKWTVGVRAASSATIKKTKCNLMEIDRLLLHPNKTYALRKQLLVLILEKGISSIPPRAYRGVIGEWGGQSLPA